MFLFNHPLVIKVTLCLIIIFTTSCTKSSFMKEDEFLNTPSYTNVHTDLWVYFHRFEKEGRIRGQDIDLYNTEIVATIDAINSRGVVGICNHNSNAPNKIVIDKIFWQRASLAKREMIVFHELGHCYLKLNHIDDVQAGGQCASIMRSTQVPCIDNYSSETRDFYLDELFKNN